MTAGAQEFVTPLTFQAVSGQPVHTDLLDPSAEAAMGHIELARWADLILIAPASANLMARVAQGMADDMLTTLCLATEAPLVMAPAMNRVMWAHPATQANRRLLASRGVTLLGPEEGSQACGEQGAGRMMEPLVMVDAVVSLLDENLPLRGYMVMVTAGPTLEDIDPVRFIGNRSSGKMGYAIAEAAAAAGAEVQLISGPVALECPAGVQRTLVRSAHDMHEQVMNHLDGVDIFISAAAVADYRPSTVAQHKIKKQESELVVELIRNPDILRAVAVQPDGPFTVGFAAETQDVEHFARGKMRDKGLDMICANLVGGEEGGFESDRNALQLFWAEGSQKLAMMEKGPLAKQLISIIVEQFLNQK
jgi:phosphopantothenoylcysteine decarboxylase/phosphopantothenate--cysteine ligase